MSIARSLWFALIALTLVLAAITAIGVASLYNAGQQFQNTLLRTANLATVTASLQSAAVDVDELFSSRSSRADAAQRIQAANAYEADTASATGLAASDRASAALVGAQIAADDQARSLAARGQLARATAPGGPLNDARLLAVEVQARQQSRQTAARAQSRSSSRRDLIIIAVAGLLALGGALSLLMLLVGSMRRPLEALVDATRALAAGELERRVEPAGPRELQDLGAAFNAMGEELARAQHTIEEERRRLAVTIESLGDALLVTEPGSTTIAAVNPRAAELVPELPVGAHVDSERSPLPPLEAALQGETVIDHDGRALAITAAPLGSEAEGMVWTVRDMSERARLERAKSEFVATASHELRSPLTSIKGFAELLERSPEQMSDRQREFVHIILRSTDRLVNLVNDLLDMARIEADHVEINRRPIDVGETVRDVTELMGPQIADKRQELRVDVSPTVPLALADPGLVRQIVANLLTNAHLYTGEGGWIHVGVEADRAWVRIIVQDSGVGMTDEELRHAFERFYRGPNRGRTSGSGLGLPIVKSLVDMHQGQIEVDSEPGNGTKFSVLLKAAIPDHVSPRSTELMRGRRVLVVDDDPQIAELIAFELSALEVQTTTATSGAHALELLRAHHFDALTLDILMPGTDGFEVLREIRADSELGGTAIVFVSVLSGRPELAGEWMVSKPIDGDELRNVLAAAMSSGRARARGGASRAPADTRAGAR